MATGDRPGNAAQGAFTGDWPWPAPAKLNLFLHVLGRRADGYHELQTVFQFLEHGDDLYFTVRPDGEIRRLGGLEQVPEEQDLTVRAARALQSATGCRQGCDIRLVKRLPPGAGLGGGSSDAATTLVALNLLWGTSRTTDQLAAIGLRLGADVPVFVRGHAAWGEGVGERLRPVAVPERWFLVVTPPVTVATAAVFQDPELPRSTAPIRWQDFLEGRHRNDCEALVAQRHPEVAEVLAWLRQHAPARMTGTGAAVFAAFPDRDAALAISRQIPSEWHAFVAQGRNRSPLHVAAESWAKQ